MSNHEELFARERDYEERGRLITAQAAQAFNRLLQRATGPDSGQAGRVAAFIATVVGRAKFDIYELRALDVEISDDVLVCMDAIRWGKVHLTETVPGGLERAEAICREWGYSCSPAAGRPS